jgi:hypothetical protein
MARYEGPRDSNGSGRFTVSGMTIPKRSNSGSSGFAFSTYNACRPWTVGPPDPFESRAAIASTLNQLAPSISQEMVVPIFEFPK